MTAYLTAAELDALPERTVVINPNGIVAQAEADPGLTDRRWLIVGIGELSSGAEMEVGSWRVLRYGPTHADAPPMPVEGMDTYVTDGGMLSVRMVGDGTPRPVAMCTSPEWARHLATYLSAAEIEAFPAVVAAVARLRDVQREHERQRAVDDRLAATTRERVAAILGVLGLGPLTSYGVGTTAALLAIRDRAQELWRRDHKVTSAIFSAATSLWPSAPASLLDDPAAVVDRLAEEVRRLRADDERTRQAARDAVEEMLPGAGTPRDDTVKSVELLRDRIRGLQVLTSGDEGVPGVPALPRNGGTHG